MGRDGNAGNQGLAMDAATSRTMSVPESLKRIGAPGSRERLAPATAAEIG